MQGPLDLLRKGWEDPAARAEEKGIVQFVLEMRDRLEQYHEQARDNLQEAQRTQKQWYDQHARLQEFKSGQKVLLLLPTSANKLLTKWQGPYTIIQKMGPVTYEVHHPDKGKAKQTYHVNLLKGWKEPSSEVPGTSLLVRKVEDVEGECLESRAQRKPSVVNLDHLDDGKSKDLQDYLSRFPVSARLGEGKGNVTKLA